MSSRKIQTCCQSHADIHFWVVLWEHALKGIPGYAMEQFLNFGSQGLQDRLAAEEESFDEIIRELAGIKQKDIHPLYTWIREHSAMHDHAEKFCDDATREGVDTMVRQRPDGFLQNHIFSRVFPEANKYVNGVPFSENFEAIRESSDTITALFPVTDEGEDLINNEAIRKVLATFNSESQCAKEYVCSTQPIAHRPKGSKESGFACTSMLPIL